MHTKIIQLAFVYLFLLVTPTYGNGLSYTIKDLGIVNGFDLPYVNSINNNGEVAGYNYSLNGSTVAIRWSNDTLIALPDLGGMYSGAYGINDSGVIVGRSYDVTNTTSIATYWSNDSINQLSTLAGYRDSYAMAINNTGQIVGDSTNYGGNSEVTLWTNGNTQQLGLAQEAYGAGARGINDAGVVIGYSWNSIGIAHATKWENGAVIDLGTLGGRYSYAYDINNSGAVVGSSEIVSPYISLFVDQHAVLWESGVLEDLGTLGGRYSEAYGINDLNIIVGSSLTLDNSRHAFVWAEGSILDLNNLVLDQSGEWILASANAINDKNQIIGEGLFNGHNHAFLLTPVPEPKTFTLLLSGLSIIGFILRFRKNNA